MHAAWFSRPPARRLPTPGRPADRSAGARARILALAAALAALVVLPSAALAASGSISGKVTNASTTPLANLEVDVYDSGGDYVADTCTAANGTYTFSGLTPGDYYIGFSPSNSSDCGISNYLAQYYDGTATGSPTVAGWAQVAVASSATTANIDATLAGGGQISGTVRNGAAQGLPNIEVQVQTRDGEFGGSACTASDGTYSVAALPTGYYQVVFSTDGGCPNGAGNYLDSTYGASSPNHSNGTPVAVTQGQTTSGINQTMPTGSEITGTVTDGSAQPVANVAVYAFQASGPYSGPVGSVCTAANGSYAIVGLQPGTYSVGFVPLTTPGTCGGTSNYVPQYYTGSAGGAATLGGALAFMLGAGTVKANVNATLTTHGGEVTGTVTNTSGQPAANVEVDAYSPNGDELAGDAACTNGAGQYTLLGLPTGSYVLNFQPSDASFPGALACASSGDYLFQWYSGALGGAPSLANTLPVSVTAGATSSNVNTVMVTAGTISGAVVDSSAQPVANVRVTAISSAGNSSGPGACTGNDGTYTIPGLAAGVWHVEFSPGCGVRANFATAYYDGIPGGSADLGGALGVLVADGADTGNIDATLEAGASPGGQITGTVTKAGGQPLKHVEVDLYAAIFGATWATCTGADGTYAFDHLQAGSYRVEFNAAGTQCASAGDFVTQYYDDASTLAGATSVTLADGQTDANIDATLVSGGDVSGTVTDTSSHPLADVAVDAYDPSGTQLEEVCTNALGQYTLTGLASGSYDVGFQPGSEAATCFGAGDNYLAEFFNGELTLAAATAVSVSAGATTPNVNATLAVGGEITGTVKNASATPLANVGVTLYSAGNTVTGGCTAADGTYAFPGLATGSYTVRFDPSGCGSRLDYLGQYDGGAATDGTATPIAVTAGMISGNVNATLASGGEISGTVVTSSGPAIDGAVLATPVAGGGGYVGCVEANGTYSIVGLPTAQYHVEFGSHFGGCAPATTITYIPQSYASNVSVTAPNNATPINATVVPGAAIAGVVTDALTNAGVSVPVEAIASNNTLTTSTCSGSDGGYEFTGLPAGTYHVEFASPGSPCQNSSGQPTYVTQYYDGKSTLGTATAVTLTTGSTARDVDAALVANSPVNSGAPSISGSAVAGDRLDESTGVWSNAPVIYRYQWEDCNSSGLACAMITGATQRSYELTSTDVGHTVVVTETAQNSGGTAAAVQSSPTAVVTLPPVPVSSSSPTISGTAKVGQTLTEGHATWSNGPTSYAYKWEDCNSAGASCAVIGGATSQTYVVGSSDVGHTIEVSETASNAGGAGNAATSAATAQVVAASSSGGSPPAGGSTVAGIATAGGATVSGTTATVTVTCTGATSCVVSGKLIVIETLVGGKVTAITASKKKKTRTTQTLTVGTAAITVPAGQGQPLSVALNSVGVLLLGHHHQFSAALSISQTAASGSTTVVSTDTVAFKAPKKKKKP